MATPSTLPMPPNSGSPQGAPGAGGSPSSGASSPGGSPQGGGAVQKLARLAMDAQAIASESPETAQMMREVQNQVRMATMKMIQQRQATQQQTPQI